MRKPHNLSSHYHPWEIQFVTVPLVRGTRVTVTWRSHETWSNVCCMRCYGSCIVCQSSFIFLASIRVIQCAGKRQCFLKTDHGHVPLCEEPLVKIENEFNAQMPACHW